MGLKKTAKEHDLRVSLRTTYGSLFTEEERQMVIDWLFKEWDRIKLMMDNFYLPEEEKN